MGTKTDKLVEQLGDTHKRLRDSSSRSGMSAQDRALLERQISELEGSVADLTAQLGEKGVAYIKKDSTLVVDLVIRTLERARRHLQEVGVAKTQTLNKNSSTWSCRHCIAYEKYCPLKLNLNTWFRPNESSLRSQSNPYVRMYICV